MKIVAGCEPKGLFQAAFELEPSGLAVLCAPELMVCHANAAFRAAIAATVDPLGQPVEVVWPGEAGRRIRALAQRVLATGEPALHERYVHVSEDGIERVFAFHLKRLPELLPGAQGILVSLWDTSDVEEARRAAERARERAELLAAMAGELSSGAELTQVFRTALGRAASLLGAGDGSLWLFDPDGRHARGYLEIRPLGRTREALDLDLHPHSRRAADHGVAVLFGRDDASGAEAEYLRHVDARATLVAPIAERGRCTGLLHLDYREGNRWPRPEDVDFAEAIASQCSLAITRARVYESEREARGRAQAAEAEARRIGELQERLVAVVGHDLRTPVAAIRLTVDTLSKRGDLDVQVQRGIARIGTSAGRMEAIIRDLLDFARARTGGGIPVTLGRVSLDEVARQAAQEAEAATGGRVDVAVRGDCRARADASRVGQLVANLVGNALAHGEGDAAVKVLVDGATDAVRIEVHNDGPPIPREVQAHLFEPFHRSGRGRSDGGRSGHLGLGLFIVAEIARAHGGAVGVRSLNGEGTTFVVTLPRDARAPG
jgi:signal transduction histidine kinase